MKMATDSPPPPPIARSAFSNSFQQKRFPFTTQLTVPMYAASRYVKKRLTTAAEMLKSPEFWLHSGVNRDCDIVVTFRPNSSEHTVMWILTRIQEQIPDLDVHLRKHNIASVYGLYLTSNWKGMCRAAESLRIRKKLKMEYGGGRNEFVGDQSDRYEGVEDEKSFFSSQERQSIVKHMLFGLRASQDEELNGIKFSQGQDIIPRLLSEGTICQIFPLHNPATLQRLRHIWVQAFFKFQPLEVICDYFGVKIAMYFAWLGHYTAALTIPAIFGFFLWIFFYGNQATEDFCFVLFAFFNVIWTTIYLESWKRRQAELAYCWGTLDQAGEMLEEPRPQFRGKFEQSPITGRLEPTYPNWKRNLTRYFISLPIVLICLGLACTAIFSIFELEQWWILTIEDMNYPSWLAYCTKILMALTIYVMDSIYHRLALWLNNLENYRLEEEYENHLTIKIGVFQFISAFVSLFYIAFYLQNMERLRDLLATLLITRQVVGNIKESVIPFLMAHFKIIYLNLKVFGGSTPSSPMIDGDEETELIPGSEKVTEAGNGGKAKNHPSPRRMHRDRLNISQAERESNMFKYFGTFDDYLEMYIQFGYVMLFSSAFPLAAACAFLNNLVEIRSDAFKLCWSFQRPFGVRVANIGSWQIMMEIMGVTAIMVNCALIGMSGQVQRLMPHLSTTDTLVIIVILEHVLLTIKFGLAYAIPDIPTWVAVEIGKMEFKRREALREMDYMQSFVRPDNRERSASSSEFEVLSPTLRVVEPNEVVNSAPEVTIDDDPFQDVFCEREVDDDDDDMEAGITSKMRSNSDSTGLRVILTGLGGIGDPSDENYDSEEQGCEDGLRHRPIRRNSLPSPDDMTVNGSHLQPSPNKSSPRSFLQKAHLKLPSALKLTRRKSTSCDENGIGKESIEDGGTNNEDEPLVRKVSRRFSLFAHGKH